MQVYHICKNCFQVIGTAEVCPLCGWVQATLPEQAFRLYPGAEINSRYVIGRLIEAGSFNALYKAFDTKLNRLVAVKEFYSVSLNVRTPGEKKVSLYSSGQQELLQEQIRRFMAEAQAISRLGKHPNFFEVYEVLEENNTAYSVQEYVEWELLSKLLAVSGGRIEPARALNLIDEVIEGVHALHSMNIVHKDIQLDSIAVTEEGKVKIIGIESAAFLDPGSHKSLKNVLTAGFSAPELYSIDLEKGFWTDYYSIGALMYKLTTGVTPPEAVERMSKDALEKPSFMAEGIPIKMDRAIVKAMALRPEFRFRSGQHLLDALHGVRSVNYPRSALPSKKLSKKLNKVALVACLLALACAVSAMIYSFAADASRTFASADRMQEVVFWIPESDLANPVKTEAFESLLAYFSESSPDIEIILEAVAEDGYLSRLDAASSANDAPGMFYSDYINSSKIKRADLSPVAEVLDLNEYWFLESRIKETEGQSIPLGFEAVVAYVNLEAYEGLEGESYPDSLTMSSIKGNVNVTVDKSCFNSFIEFYTNKNLTILESLAEDPPWRCLIATSSRYRAVQEILIEGYTVIPFFKDSISARTISMGAFSDSISVSGRIDKEKQSAAAKFVAFLLGEHAQSVLYVQNQDALPLSRSMFRAFVGTNSELAFLEEYIDNMEMKVGTLSR
ncbi:MAG: protein kinase [Clostridiales bacterium]|nr:protein kinase [Clostridiales bacterium]